MMHDELLDVVSASDEVLTQELRSVVYQKKLYFRAVNAFVCNSKKQLWIPRRHPSKKLFALALDCSVSGHVSAGESYDAAFARETAEELSIDITQVTYTKLMRLTPVDHNTSAFMWVYLIMSDQEPAYNRQDFIEYYWLSVDELIQKLKNGEPAKSDLLPIVSAIKDHIASL